MRTLLCFGFMVFLSFSSNSQQHIVAPVEKRDFTVLTSYDELQTFLREVNGHGIQVDSIAVTKQGRGIFAARASSSTTFGADAQKVRVLLFAQQHGDEPSGKEAMTLLIAGLASGNHNKMLSSIDLLIVPQMNPDGSELRQRRTADSIDLNRNHVLLTSPATKALHDLFDQWKPDVTVDIHEYASFSPSFIDSGMIRTADVQLGMLTNPNTSPAIYSVQHDSIYPFVAKEMANRPYHFHEYIVGSADSRIRHSTTEINDGRQSFGILGTISFIQEGRKWQTMEEQLERRAKSQLASVEALLAYCSGHATQIKQVVRQERDRLTSMKPGEMVAVRMDHYPGQRTMQIPVLLLPGQKDSTWSVRPYHPEVRTLKDVALPESYFIRKEQSSIIALLERHHVKMTKVTKPRWVDASTYLVDSIGVDVIEEDSLPKPSVRVAISNSILREGDVIVNTNQIHSLFLATVLEPESQWGLMKYPQFEPTNGNYPVMRIP
ncbi:MAG: M14 family zinc carboxypeptidase [Bacteroidota bacterium]